MASHVTSNSRSGKPISRLIKWTQKIGSKAKVICSRSHGYVKMVQEERPVKVPDGYIGVYVGTEGEFQRVIIPVVYFNHPLFKQLLEKYEDVFGVDYLGPITIPCPMSEFEHIQSMIKKDS